MAPTGRRRSFTLVRMRGTMVTVGGVGAPNVGWPLLRRGSSSGIGTRWVSSVRSRFAAEGGAPVAGGPAETDNLMTLGDAGLKKIGAFCSGSTADVLVSGAGGSRVTGGAPDFGRSRKMGPAVRGAPGADAGLAGAEMIHGGNVCFTLPGAPVDGAATGVLSSTSAAEEKIFSASLAKVGPACGSKCAGEVTSSSWAGGGAYACSSSVGAGSSSAASLQISSGVMLAGLGVGASGMTRNDSEGDETSSSC